jgi:DNA-binding response OmpR family regulator
LDIALLEDEPGQAQLVIDWMRAAGHSVEHETHGEAFLRLCRSKPFDLAILDWELPDISGIEVLNKLRGSEGHTFPVLFATQRDAEEDVVKALLEGADDFLVKPLKHDELLARMSAVCRRAGIGTEEDKLNLADIHIDIKKRQITRAGVEVSVTQKDFDLAVEFFKNVGKILSREYLMQRVWGVKAELNTRTVDVHVSRIRRSLGIQPEMGYCIRTIYQHGYRLENIAGSDSES